jgi:hypothetical protein
MEFRRRHDRPMRAFVTPHGVYWKVYEADVSASPGAEPTRALIADSDGVVRRFREFPDGWHMLTDPELEHLIASPIFRQR